MDIPPSIIYLDTSKGAEDGFGASNSVMGDDMDLMMIDDDDMLDVTAEFEQNQQHQSRSGYNHNHHAHMPTRTFSSTHQEPVAMMTTYSSACPSKPFLRQVPAVSFSSDSLMFSTSGEQPSVSGRHQQRRRTSGFRLKREGQGSLFPGSSTSNNNSNYNNNNSNHSSCYYPNQAPSSKYTNSTVAATSCSGTPSVSSGYAHGGCGGAGAGAGEYGSMAASVSPTTTSVSVSSTHLASQYMEGMRRLSRSIRHSEMTRSALRREGLSLRSSSLSAHSLPPEMLLAMSQSVTGGCRSPSFSSSFSTSLRQQQQQPSSVPPPLSPPQPTLVVADIEELDDDDQDQSQIFAAWAAAATSGSDEVEEETEEDETEEERVEDDFAASLYVAELSRALQT